MSTTVIDSAQQQPSIQEFLKCKVDPIYFIENYIKIFNQTLGVVPFRMFEKQKEFIRLWLEKHKVIILKSRQTGMTTTLQQLQLWLALFHSKYYIGVMSIEQEKSNQFLADIVELYNMSELNKIPWLPKLEKPLKKSLHFSNGSIIRQGNTNNPFRSYRMTTVIVDEQQFIPDLDQQLKQLAPTLQTIAKSGIPWGIILNSTPNGVNNDYYKFYYQQISQPDPPYVLFKFHWRDVPYYDDEWYKQQCEILNNDYLAIMQELELHFISSQDTYIDPDVLQKLQDHKQKPIQTINIEGFEVEIFKEVEEGKSYIIGVDVQSGLSNDQSQFVVIDEYGEVVQDFVHKRINDVELANILYQIGMYYNSQQIQIEVSGGWGLSVSRRLRERGYPNVFQDRYLTKDDAKPNVDLERKQQTRTYGIITNSLTRPIILKSLKEFVTDFPEKIKSEKIISELLTFVYRSGKPQQMNGHNDDLVMATQFQYYQRNQLIENNMLNVSKTYDSTVGTLISLKLRESHKISNNNETNDIEEIQKLESDENQKPDEWSWIQHI